MTAAVLTRHGGAGALEVRDDWPVPTAGPGEVLVRVGAAAVNNTDIWTREGAYGLPGQPDAKARRQRDVCTSAGLTMSVQDTVGPDIAFAAIVHIGQTVPKKLLRCALESRDMVSVKTADGDFPVIDGRVIAPATPGLGITPRLDALGAPVATYA
jgi:hypothetical protein